MVVFNGFEILEWAVLAIMLLIFIVGTILGRLNERFKNWKDKRRKRKL